MKLQALLSLVLLASPCFGFQTTGRRSASFQRHKNSAKLQLAPEHLNDIHTLLDSPALTHIADAAQAALNTDGNVITDAMQSAADALEAVTETEVEIAADQGWWSAYLNIFKSSLNFVHDTVDGPLRNAGIEQTWGVSIAIFTASKCHPTSIS